MEKDSTDLLPPTLRKGCPTGTGYNNHRKHKEQACESCLQGARERNKRSYKRVFARKNLNNKDKYKAWKLSTPTLGARLPPTIRPSCSLGKGYSLHRYNGELPCESCLEGRRKSARDYAAINKERFLENNRAKNRFRRARKLAVIHEEYLTQDVLDLYGADCYICYDPIDLTLPRRVGQEGWEKGLHIDHLVPLAKGGDDTLENVRPAHGLCNVKKGIKEYDLSTTLVKDGIMTVNNSRSQNASLDEGATDGKYRKARPNTTVIPGLGDQKVKQDRAGLHPYMNYGFINSEEVSKVNPGK